MIKYMAALSLCLLLSNCAHVSAYKAKGEMQTTLDSLMGKTKEEVVLTLGPPTEASRVGELEILSFKKSYGMRAGIVAGGGYMTSAMMNQREAFDIYRVYFKNGKAIKSDGRIDR